ncbi:hypothetical protein RRF57_000066 [Xylaria bambusicola]|uniref:Uncharacterized protein n=1 Tax=Xylaria bambusicola TaxID=326684 RepID=A0AAN7YTU7_9PEZI
MRFGACEIGTTAPQTTGLLHDRPLTTVSLEEINSQKLTMLMRLIRQNDVMHHSHYKDRNFIFTEFVALLHHNGRLPLGQYYTSMKRNERFMSHEPLITN